MTHSFILKDGRTLDTRDERWQPGGSLAQSFIVEPT